LVKLKVSFAVNLKMDTIDPEFIEFLDPSGWLTAPDNAYKKLRERLSEVRSRNQYLYTDNGNFSLIGDVAESLETKAKEAKDSVSEYEDTLGRTVKRSELPEEIKMKVAEIAQKAVNLAEKMQEIKEAENPLAEQIALNPSHIIGVEDIVPAVLLRLDFKFEWLPYDRSYFKRRNQSIAKRGTKVLLELNPDISYYPVASAMDYNTAYDAGKIFAAAGHKHVAIGMGAFMADNSYVDGYRYGRRWVKLGKLIPNRYLSTALVTRGFFDGYQNETGSAPEGFHFLGLGAPIMLPIVTRAAWGTKHISFDATSPIMDAVERTIYVNSPAYLKIRTWKVADRLANSPNEEWNCPCLFCQDFLKEYPIDYDSLRDTLSKSKKPVDPDDLREDGLYYQAATLLSEPRSGVFRKAVSMARMGHNHWVLYGICQQLNQVAENEWELDQHLNRIVEDYTANTSGERFAEAIKLALKICRNE
jgi:hypothetical protein